MVHLFLSCNHTNLFFLTQKLSWSFLFHLKPPFLSLNLLSNTSKKHLSFGSTIKQVIINQYATRKNRLGP
uniref:Uncharacterized protein n=1 Tax=Helianthus annuus TaxID=4232 RepID=A0A251UJL2_HELAN